MRNSALPALLAASSGPAAACGTTEDAADAAAATKRRRATDHARPTTAAPSSSTPRPRGRRRSSGAWSRTWSRLGVDAGRRRRRQGLHRLGHGRAARRASPTSACAASRAWTPSPPSSPTSWSPPRPAGEGHRADRGSSPSSSCAGRRVRPDRPDEANLDVLGEVTGTPTPPRPTLADFDAKRRRGQAGARRGRGQGRAPVHHGRRLRVDGSRLDPACTPRARCSAPSPRSSA